MVPAGEMSMYCVVSFAVGWAARAAARLLANMDPHTLRALGSRRLLPSSVVSNPREAAFFENR